MAVLGFEELEYTVGEEEGSVEVCVRVLQPDEVHILPFALISTANRTALGTVLLDKVTSYHAVQDKLSLMSIFIFTMYSLPVNSWFRLHTTGQFCGLA